MFQKIIYLLEKAATIKRFEYSAADSELKKQTGTAKKTNSNHKRTKSKTREGFCIQYNSIK